MYARIKQLLAVLILGAAVSVLAPPMTAHAAPQGPATPGLTIYRKSPAPTPPALATAPGIDPMATGGGCAPDSEQSACITYFSTDHTLRSDFYINSWSPISSSGGADMWIVVNGTYNYMYTVSTNHLGHYPLDWVTVGSGTGRTVVVYFNSGGSVVYTGYSPWVNYP